MKLPLLRLVCTVVASFSSFVSTIKETTRSCKCSRYDDHLVTLSVQCKLQDSVWLESCCRTLVRVPFFLCPTSYF